MNLPSVLSDSRALSATLQVLVDTASAPKALLAALHRLTGARFVSTGPHHACLRPGEQTKPQRPTPDRLVSTLACSRSSSVGEKERFERVRVLFGDDASTPWPFRGRQLFTTIPADCQPLVPLDGERVLASIEAGALWTARTAEDCTHYRSALPLREIPSGGGFAQVFSGATFLANLPLLHLLAQFEATRVGVRQALRAAFMFDDPNLHWPSYGYVNYANLSAEAARENFHVSFATIPLDSWFTHMQTAARFREHPDRLSLLVHGNNHTRHELAGKTTRKSCLALLQQARRRIERLERHAQISVDRVMVPPHGACSEEMLAALPEAGFAGACLSAGSLMAHNAESDWIQSLGFCAAEWVRGCPVMPRWALVGTEESELLVAAYLGRPIILRGHHGDLREGLDILVHHARSINALGDVHWTNNAELLRSSYHLSVSGRTAYLRLFARQVALTLPEQVTSLVLESPGSASGTEQHIVSGLCQSDVRVLSGRSVEIDQGRDSAASIVVSLEATQSKAGAFPMPGLRPSSVLRRILTEARDRLMPLTT